MVMVLYMVGHVIFDVGSCFGGGLGKVGLLLFHVFHVGCVFGGIGASHRSETPGPVGLNHLHSLKKLWKLNMGP